MSALASRVLMAGCVQTLTQSSSVNVCLTTEGRRVTRVSIDYVTRVDGGCSMSFNVKNIILVFFISSDPNIIFLWKRVLVIFENLRND